MPSHDHFKGKTVPEHLKAARIKGAIASAETHGTEMPGHVGAFADALRDTALTLSLLWVVFEPILSTKHLTFLLALFLLGWGIWKTARSASLGFARLERLHRVIEEERWEIQHHREQEREELIEIYRAKGFEGDLLNQVIDVLMADDNRLLQIMLEEELGLSLETHEHPLKQASGALLGTALFAVLAFSSHLIFGGYGFITAAFVCFLAAGVFTAKLEKVTILPAFVWNATVFLFTVSLIHLVQRFMEAT